MVETDLRRRADCVSRPQILAAERELLRALCTGTPQGARRDTALRWLGGYTFQDVIHQVLFEALKQINTYQPQVLRQQLPALLTRQGFPEAELEEFLTSPNLSEEQTVELIEKLRAWTRAEASPDTDAR